MNMELALAFQNHENQNLKLFNYISIKHLNSTWLINIVHILKSNPWYQSQDTSAKNMDIPVLIFFITVRSAFPVTHTPVSSIRKNEYY